jgi:hypothetical protein
LRHAYDNALRLAREQLGDSQWQSALDLGAMLGLDEAFNFALNHIANTTTALETSSDHESL